MKFIYVVPMIVCAIGLVVFFSVQGESRSDKAFTGDRGKAVQITEENAPPFPACTLSEPDLAKRTKGILAAIGDSIEEVTELANGISIGFVAEDELLSKLAEVINLERKCCSFLQFALVVEANHGPVRLELTGPEGTKEFLQQIVTKG